MNLKNFNIKLTRLFEKLLQFNKQKGDIFRTRAYAKTISIIKNLDFKITLKNVDSLSTYEGIGKKTLEKIKEFLKTGNIKSVKKNIVSKSLIDKLEDISGVGPKTAEKWINTFKLKTFTHFKKEVKNKEIKLTHHQKIGLKYYKDLKQRIPRSEITSITKKIRKNILEWNTLQLNTLQNKKYTIKMIVTGSFRRGLKSSKDIDILLTIESMTKSKVNKKDIFKELIDFLKKKDIIKDVISFKSSKFMGIVKDKKESLNRRCDIMLIDKSNYYSALLYFTGSKDLNRKMRYLAKKKNYLLNEYGLFKLKDGRKKKVKITSERDIFKKLGIDYLEPMDRSI